MQAVDEQLAQNEVGSIVPSNSKLVSPQNYISSHKTTDELLKIQHPAKNQMQNSPT